MKAPKAEDLTVGGMNTPVGECARDEAGSRGRSGAGAWKGLRHGRGLGARVTVEQVWTASSWGPGSLGDPEK